MNDLERKLWAKVDGVVGEKYSFDICDMLDLIHEMPDEELEQLDHDDFALALSGIDEGAFRRIDARKDFEKMLRNYKQNKKETEK